MSVKVTHGKNFSRIHLKGDAADKFFRALTQPAPKTSEQPATEPAPAAEADKRIQIGPTDI